MQGTQLSGWARAMHAGDPDSIPKVPSPRLGELRLWDLESCPSWTNGLVPSKQLQWFTFHFQQGTLVLMDQGRESQCNFSWRGCSIELHTFPIHHIPLPAQCSFVSFLESCRGSQEPPPGFSGPPWPPHNYPFASVSRMGHSSFLALSIYICAHTCTPAVSSCGDGQIALLFG